MLLCHYCNLEKVPPAICQECLDDDCEVPPSRHKKTEEKGLLVQRGGGTEKVHQEVAKLFPGVVIDRLDRDTVNDLNAYRQILDRIRNHKSKILVGTQMIAKGHDLPDVTVVGVVDCDVGLHFPDFRASERSFQLLVQAAGRAGRAERQGKVILQTRLPKNHTIQSIMSGNYKAFAATELKKREQMAYPPFVKLLRIIISSTERSSAEANAATIKRIITKTIENEKLSITIKGPSPATIEKIRARWRFHVLLKATTAKQLSGLVSRLQTHLTFSKKVRVAYDLDPQDML